MSKSIQSPKFLGYLLDCSQSTGFNIAVLASGRETVSLQPFTIGLQYSTLEKKKQQHQKVVENRNITIENVHDQSNQDQNIKLKPIINTDGGKQFKYSDFLLIPNLISYSRVILSPVACYFLIDQQFMAAALVSLYCGFSDILDGWAARYFNQNSKLGSLIDPIADKLFLGALLLTLTYIKIVPLWAFLIILSKDMFLIAGSLVYGLRQFNQPAIKDLSLSLKFQKILQSFPDIKPIQISKYSTFLQICLVSVSCIKPIFNNIPLIDEFQITLGILASATSLASIYGYIKVPFGVLKKF